jgi:hypothetical protein
MGIGKEGIFEGESKSMNTLEELKQSPSFRYTRELVKAFDEAGIANNPIEIAMKDVMDAPMPDYMPVAAATKAKIIFILTLYQNGRRLGSILDALPGMATMISVLAEELQK